MNFKGMVAAALLALVALLAKPAAGDEMQDRRQVYDTVREMLWGERYEELERLAEQYRTEGTRTGSGLWRIGMFYRGLEIMFESCEGECTRLIDAWIAAYPKSPTPRLAYVSLRLYWVRLEANESKARLSEARRYLEAHKAIAARDPNWYQMMLEIATNQAWTRREFDALLAEAREKAPGYYPIYFTALLYYQRYATNVADEIEALAADALTRTRGTDGAGLYARIYWYAAQVEFGGNLTVYSDVRWPVMKQGMEDVLARYPDAWNISNFAYFACVAKDDTLTRALMARITGEPDPEIWGYGDAFETCKARSRASGG